MEKVSIGELRDREVVNVCDGKRLGYVFDVEIDICTGRVCSLIVPGELKYFGFCRNDDYIVPWECIERIGDDIILVNVSKLCVRECRVKEKGKKK